MPRRSKGPRLWLQPARRDGHGTVVEQAVWVIRDGSTKRSTGCCPREIERATERLKDYLNAKPASRVRDRDPAAVAIADVVAIYAEDVVSKHARPRETAARLDRILDFFGDKSLAFLNKKSCTDYVNKRGSQGAARRELEDLRSAVRHHWEAGLCTAPTPVVLPDRGQGRDRWLTRQEAALFLRTARRMRQMHFGKPTDRATAQHVAQFFLVGIYTGSRAGAICGAAIDRPTIGRSWIDLEKGIFTGKPLGAGSRKIRNRPRCACRRSCWLICDGGSAKVFRSTRWSSGTGNRSSGSIKRFARFAGRRVSEMMSSRTRCATPARRG